MNFLNYGTFSVAIWLFIGPRPERQFFIDQIMKEDPRYRFLFQIRPGVTSYATLYNGYTDTLEKMVRRLRYDLFYLEHRSWGFDFKILFMTFMSIVFWKEVLVYFLESRE